MVLAAASIKYDFFDSLFDCSPSQFSAHARRGFAITGSLARPEQPLFQRTGGDHGMTPGVVDDLGVHVPITAEHGQPQATVSIPAHTVTNPQTAAVLLFSDSLRN